MNDKTFRLLLVIFLFILLVGVLGIVSYYFLIVVPEENEKSRKFEEQKIEDQNEREDQKEAEEKTDESQDEISDSLDEWVCTDSVDKTYQAYWDETCTTNGLPADCSLPQDTAKYITDMWQDARGECTK